MALFPLLPFLSRSQRGNCKHPWNRNSNCRRDGSCKESSFFFFLEDIYYMSFLTTQSHILLMQKLFPIPTSDNQDICFGTRKNSKSGSGKKGYHFCWDEFSKLLEKRNPHQKSCFTDDHWHQKAIKWLKVAKATCIEPPSNFKQDAFWWFILARIFHLFLLRLYFSLLTGLSSRLNWNRHKWLT